MGSSLSKGTVCVVDDDPLVRAVVVSLLIARGSVVVEAADGEAAVRALGDVQPQLMITDIMMPKQDGIETIREVRRRFPDTRILAMSGSSPIGRGADFLSMARKLGADACIEKPFDKQQFIELVETLLGPPAS